MNFLCGMNQFDLVHWYRHRVRFRNRNIFLLHDFVRNQFLDWVLHNLLDRYFYHLLDLYRHGYFDGVRFGYLDRYRYLDGVVYGVRYRNFECLVYRYHLGELVVVRFLVLFMASETSKTAPEVVSLLDFVVSTLESTAE